MTTNDRVSSVLLVLLVGTACLFVLGTGLLADADTVKTVTSRDGLGSIVLPNGSRFQTTLYRLKVVGELSSTSKSPYFVLSGFGCSECDANRSIYIHSPSDGPMKGEAEQQRFLYPGRESDAFTHRVIYKSRAFLGDCVAMYPNAVVWFERFATKEGQWHSRVVVAEVKSDNLAVQNIETNLPKIQEAVTATTKGQCKEIPGINRLSEP